MGKIRRFLFNAFFGGFVIILPVFILYKVIVWLVELFSNSVEPITALLNRFLLIPGPYALLLTAVSVFMLCALLGMLVRTRLGGWLHQLFENTVLGRIPGYKTIKDIVGQVTGGQRHLFKKVVLMRFSDDGPTVTGFIVDEYDNDRITVFVPTGPNPTTGIIFHTGRDSIKELDIPIETAFKSIIACGAGSGQFVTQMRTAPVDAD